MIRRAAILALLAVPAFGQGTQCAPRAEIVKGLADGYGERPVNAGLANAGNVIEIFASEGGATWTLTVTTPQGVTCVLTAGEAWQPAPIPGEDG